MTADRLVMMASGLVRYTLKTPYRDGTTHVVLEREDSTPGVGATVVGRPLRCVAPRGEPPPAVKDVQREERLREAAESGGIIDG